MVKPLGIASNADEPKIREESDILLSIKSRRENFLKRPTTTKMNKQTHPKAVSNQ